MKKRVKVRVQLKGGTPGIEKTGEDSYLARISAVPEKGKANKELIGILAEHFDVPHSNVRIVCGRTSRNKLVDIERGD